jgi:ABC-type bacteriocin transporter
MKNLKSLLKGYICVRQHDISDCGAACLATVARTYGLKMPISTIRQFAGTDRRGTNVLGLIEAAGHLGFEAKGVRGNINALAQLPLPAIAHVLQGSISHYVVIHRVHSRGVVVADPAKGIVAYSNDEFARIWTGVLVILAPSATFRIGEASAGPWRRFARLLEPHDFLLAETLMASLFLMLLGLGVSLYIQLLVDRVLVNRDWSMLRWLSLGLIAVIVFRAAFGAVRSALLAYISQKVDVSLMLEYYRHVLRLPMGFFDSRQTGEIISRLGDAVKVREVISGTTLSLMVDTATMAAACLVLSLYSLKLVALSMLMLPALALAIYSINRPLKRAQRSTMEEAASLQSYLVESLSGAATLKALGAEDRAGFKTEKRIVALLMNLFRATMWAATSGAAAELITGVGTVAVLWVAGSMVMKGQLTVGQLVAFYSILAYVLQPMLRLVGANQLVQDAIIAADRLGEILDLDDEFKEQTAKIELPPEPRGDIKFTNVAFRYGTRQQVLYDIDLDIPARSTIAIVGESGSGKTTLAKLLLRFYDPIAGQVTLDGYDMRDLSLDSIRSAIGYVDQDMFLFSGTIEENLRLGNPTAKMERLIDCVRDAGLEAFINGLPARYDTYIGERGVSVSGGQRQRLAIARALVPDPRILIFDEATSNLDPQTERALQATIEKLKRDKTIIIIAHRLSTVRSADQIVVLDNGRISEKGTHEELLRTRGRYREFWSAQTLIPVDTLPGTAEAGV